MIFYQCIQLTRHRVLIGICLLCMFVIHIGGPNASAAQKPVKRIAFVLDGPEMTAKGLLKVFQDELRQLLSGDYSVRFPGDLIQQADYTADGARQLLKRMINRSDVDLVITLGPLSSRETCLLKQLPKPVIAAMILDHEHQKVPYRNGTSGVKNLSYIEMPDTFKEDLLTLFEIRAFNNLVLLGGRSLFAAIPGAEHGSKTRVAFLDTDVHLIEAGPDVDSTLAAIPKAADAVYLLPVPEMSMEKHEQLLRALALKRLPVFSLIGHALVRNGALAGMNKADWINRLARRAALNARKILDGQAAGQLPVAISRQAQLMVNMQTARISGIYPPFKVLTEATVINVEPEKGIRNLTLMEIMDEAVLVNLDLAATGRNNAAGDEAVDQARSLLRPQLSVRATGTLIDKDRAESVASPAEQTLTGALNLTQTIWSDKTWANLSIEKMLRLRRTMEWEQTRLDVALDAANAYLNVLLAKTEQEIQLANLRLSRSNLERAKMRLELGAASAAEVYRLESRIGQERADLLSVVARRKVVEIELNRLLAYPLEQPFQLAEVGLDDQVSLLLSPQVTSYADNAHQLDKLKQFLVAKGLTASPELVQIDTSIQVEKRRWLTAKRAFYSPDVTLSGELSQLVDETGAGADLSTAGATDDTDWNLSLNLSLPLWEGGGRLADKRQSRETLKALRLQRRATFQRIEQRIRSAVHQASASYGAIDLLQRAAHSSRRNFDLVADGYSRGTVPLIDLLDAQTTYLQAEQRAASANYNFLLDLMELERSLGRFTFFAPPDEREAWLADLLIYFKDAEKK